MTTSCPTFEHLLKFLTGELTDEIQQKVAEHVDTCKDCQLRLDEEHATHQLGLGGIEVPASPDSDALRKRMSNLKAPGFDCENGSAGQTSAEINLKDIQPWLSKSQRAGGLQQVDEFVLDTCIGRGGMGIVFHAHDTKLDRDVAFKFMSPGLLSDPKAADRFVREAKAAAGVAHPNVVTIHAVGEFYELPYLVMELICGESLADRIAKRQITIPELVNIGKQIANGLTAAHKAHVQHRDIKPANVLLQEDSDDVKIVDFGLAKPLNSPALTQTGTTVGTPEFMAPEQLNTSGEIDERCDLFSLGAVLYACLAGESPFSAPSTLGSLNAVCLSDPRPIQSLAPRIPTWLADLIMRLLEKDPAARPQTAREVLEILESRKSTITPPPVKSVVRPTVAPPVHEMHITTPQFSRIRRPRRAALHWPIYAVVIIGSLLLMALGFALSQPGNGNAGSNDSGDNSSSERDSGPLEVSDRTTSLKAETNDSTPNSEVVDVERAMLHMHEVVTSEELRSLLAEEEEALEIRLNGDKFYWPDEPMVGRTVTVSNAPGKRPLLVFETFGRSPALASIDSQVRFAGLRMELVGFADDDAPIEGLMQFETSSVSIENCDLKSDSSIPSISLQESSASITGCDFDVPNCSAIQWHPEHEQELWLEDNAFVTEVILECAGTNGSEIVIAKNRFAGSIAIELDAEELDDGEAALRVRMIDNVFAAAHAVCAIYDLSEEGETGLGLSRFSWQGKNNTFPTQLAIVVNDEEEVSYSTFEEFESLVNLDDEGSIQKENVLGMDQVELELRLERNEMSAVDLRELKLK